MKARRRAAGVYASHVCTFGVKSVTPLVSVHSAHVFAARRRSPARSARRSRWTATPTRRPFRPPNRQYQQRDGHSEQKRQKQARRDHPHPSFRPASRSGLMDTSLHHRSGRHANVCRGETPCDHRHPTRAQPIREIPCTIMEAVTTRLEKAWATMGATRLPRRSYRTARMTPIKNTGMRWMT